MNQLPNSDVPTDIAQRIVSAADQLYEENGRAAFPNVDSVRRKARVNMNDASAVMRIWRRTQATAPAPLTASIPETVQSACQAMLATVWTAATDSASTGLQMAQAGWEQERVEAEACRQQLASAFDSQTEELGLAQQHRDALATRLAVLEAELQGKDMETEEFKGRTVDAEGKVATANARADEIAKRVDDLRAELSRAYQSLDQERQEAKHRAVALESTISSLRDEAHHKWVVESELREELARMRGQADAMADGHSAMQASPGDKPNIPRKRTGTGKAKQSNDTKS